MANPQPILPPPTAPAPTPALAPPPAADADIRGVKPPVEIPTAWLWLVWLLLALVAAALLTWYLRRRRRPVAATTPAIPPHVRARQQLEAALALLDQPGPFVVAISQVLRVYLEEQFSLHAPERTTEEFLLELRSSQLLDLDQKQRLAEFLSGCDLVKFARYDPTEAELRNLHASALRLVNETEPRPDFLASTPNPQAATSPAGSTSPPATSTTRPSTPTPPLASLSSPPGSETVSTPEPPR